jgi:hypothetical protein
MLRERRRDTQKEKAAGIEKSTTLKRAGHHTTSRMS